MSCVSNCQSCQTFLLLISHYIRFVKDFASIISSLTDFTNSCIKGTKVKNYEIHWIKECHMVFEKLKSALVNTDVFGLS